MVIQASGHHPRVCGCCYCLPAPHARLAPLRVPGGNCRSRDQSPRVHGVHLVHVSKTTNQREAGKELRKACCRSGALAPVTDHHHVAKYRLPPGFKPLAARRHWQHAASNDARDRTMTTIFGNAAIARCATVTAERKRLHRHFMRGELASDENNARVAGQSRRTQRRALCGPQITKDVRANRCKELVLAM